MCFLTLLCGSSVPTSPIKAPDVCLSSTQFIKQHCCREKVVIRTSLAVVVCMWPCQSIWRWRADPYPGIWERYTDPNLDMMIVEILLCVMTVSHKSRTGSCECQLILVPIAQRWEYDPTPRSETAYIQMDTAAYNLQEINEWMYLFLFYRPWAISSNTYNRWWRSLSLPPSGSVYLSTIQTDIHWTSLTDVMSYFCHL